MRITFLGNPKFSRYYLNSLIEAGHEIVEIDDSPDLGVIAYYGKIIPEKELGIPKHGFINIHPSLLPEYRGPSPVRSAILAGERKTGVTIHITRRKVDAGEIILQKEFPIDPEDNYEKLEEKLFTEGAAMLPEAIESWLSGKIVAQVQDESKATYTKIFKTEDGHINWEDKAEGIVRRIKALSPNPGTFALLEGKRLLILDAKAEAMDHNLAHGEITRHEKGFKIAAKNGFVIPITMKLEGRKEISAGAFLNGRLDILGKKLN